MDVLLDALPEKSRVWFRPDRRLGTRVILGFVENLDVHCMIVAHMSRCDENQLENLIKGSTNEQLDYVTYQGGVLGRIGGLVTWPPRMPLRRSPSPVLYSTSWIRPSTASAVYTPTVEVGDTLRRPIP